MAATVSRQISGIDFDRVERGLFPLAAFLACLAVRVSTLHLNFWEAELIAAKAIGLGWGELFRDRFAAGELPLYYALLKLFGLSGASEFALRLPTALFDSAACALFAVVARRASGRIGGLMLVLGYSFMPVLIRFGQEARPHALLACCFALALFAATTIWRVPHVAVAALERQQRRGARRLRIAFALLIIGMAAAGWTMVIGWLAVLTLQASVIVAPRLWRVPGFLRAWLIASGAAWLAILPAIIFVFPHLDQVAQSFWTPDAYQPDLRGIWSDMRSIYGWPAEGDMERFFPPGWNEYLALEFAALALAGVATTKRPPIRQAGFVAIAVPAALFAAHLARSGVVLRYVHPSLWCLCLVAAAGAAWLARRWAGRIVVAAAAVTIVLQGLDGIEAPRKASWKPFLDFYAGNGLGAADGIATDAGLALIFEHYLPLQARPAAIDIEASAEGYRAAVARFMASRRLFWILSARPLDSLLADIPSSAAICSGAIGYHSFLIVGQRAADLPPAIRNCASAGR